MQKYFFEFRQLIKIGIPIFGSQLSYALMGATDTIIAGRASANDLAGLAVGTAFSNTIWFFFTGIIFAVTPIVAQLYGAKKFLEIGKKLREILWVAAALGLFMAFIFFNMNIIIDLLPIKSSITSITIDYLKAVSIGWFFVTIFTCLRCYSEGMTYTKPVFYIAFAGMLLNIPLDLIFVYGYFGAPKLGGVGCGIATSIVSFIMMISIFIYIINIIMFFNIGILEEIFAPPRIASTGFCPELITFLIANTSFSSNFPKNLFVKNFDIIVVDA